MMKKAVFWLLRFFRTLHWRLTLSYLLVTLVVVFAVEIVNTLTDAATLQANQSATFAQSLEDTVLPQIMPALEASPPDRDALNKWAKDFIFPSVPSKDGSAPAGTLPSKYALVVILDRNGQILAAVPDDARVMQQFFWDSQSQKMVEAALGSSPGTAKVRALDGQTIVALPIKGLGVFFTVFKGQVEAIPAVKGNVIDLLLLNLRSEFPLLALAGAVGIVSGLLGSRSIRRPLRQIAQAADAWSRGDFSVKTQAASRDELGQLARDLNSMADQLQTLLATRQELAVVEERHRLARDLHDSIKQQMFVITLLVGAAREMVADHPQAAQTLSEAVRLTGQAQQELTALIHELRPLALAGKGLSAALAELLSSWEQSTGIAVEAHLASDVHASLATEQALFRIAQEALNNVARHSGATSVNVCLSQEPERLLLRVQDN
ncbi:MAG TPA: histidine kinase, partial [Ktedonobacterales bacterium]|nr:histidine kinase [Ktedonobacterales bacterium]